jgi:hypothetical protein
VTHEELLQWRDVEEESMVSARSAKLLARVVLEAEVEREAQGLLVESKDILLSEALAERDALRAEVERLREALGPIGEFVSKRGNLAGTGEWNVRMSGDELEIIRTALAQGSEATRSEGEK